MRVYVRVVYKRVETGVCIRVTALFYESLHNLQLYKP